MQKISVKDKKINIFSESKAHNLESLGGIHKKNATLSETSLLKNCGKLSRFSTKN